MNKKVLLINNINARHIIPELLTRAGYSVDVVYDSAAGLRELDNQAHDVTIVQEAPTAEIWQLCAKIKSRTGIPLIVISPSAGTETCVKAINAGADYFMRKPFGPLEFLARIGSLLQRAPVRQPVTAGL
jgi:DNA-binding response OmpR family regulator